MARRPTSDRKAAGAKQKAARKAAQRKGASNTIPPRDSATKPKQSPPPPPKKAAPTARKRRDYKAEYARRMAGKAKGTPEYKKSRGHKPGVSERQQRIASRERDMWDYALAQQRRAPGADADDLMDMLRDGVREHGPVWFRRLERQRNEWHRDYVEAGWPKGGVIVGVDRLEEVAETFETDSMLLFYH